MLMPEKAKAQQRQEPVTQRSHFPPLLSSPEDQDYDNTMSQPVQGSIQHTVGCTTSSFLTPSRYSTSPSPCKIRSLPSAPDGKTDREAQVQPSPESCWAKPGGYPSTHLSRCPALPQQQKQALKSKGSFPTIWPRTLHEFTSSESVQRSKAKASHPWEKQHNSTSPWRKFTHFKHKVAPHSNKPWPHTENPQAWPPWEWVSWGC